MVNSLTAETVEGAGLTFRACLHRGGGGPGKHGSPLSWGTVFGDELGEGR